MLEKKFDGPLRVETLLPGTRKYPKSRGLKLGHQGVRAHLNAAAALEEGMMRSTC